MKTQILPIPPHRVPPFALPVTHNSEDMPVVPSTKYLGLHFDTSMCWQTMVQRVAIMVSAKIAVLVRHAASLPLSCRICYFKCFVLPEFLYASNSPSGKALHCMLYVKCPHGPPPVTLLERVHVSPLRATFQLNLLCFIWHCLNSSGSRLF